MRQFKHCASTDPNYFLTRLVNTLSKRITCYRLYHVEQRPCCLCEDMILHNTPHKSSWSKANGIADYAHLHCVESFKIDGSIY